MHSSEIVKTELNLLKEKISPKAKKCLLSIKAKKMKTFLNNFSNPQCPPTKGMKEFDKKKGGKLCSRACQYNSFIFGENI
jgi:hypothetical protein